MAKSLIKEADAQAQQALKDSRLWKKELQLASKRESAWRKDGQKIIDRYTGKDKKRNRFNILWSNTEILRPAIYNTRPQPDVRRRFRDADPVGKAVSEVIERALFVVTDGYEFDCIAKNDVLDSLLPGRGISRVKYVAKITETPQEEAAESDDEETQESLEPNEEVEYEQVMFEHVDWEDFRHGWGRTWDEVPWEGFRHKLTEKDAIKLLGKEQLGKLEFAVPTNNDNDKPGEVVNETAKVAEFWEIWDKVGAKVFFLQDELDHLLFPVDNPTGDAPLEFDGFFPNPEPLKIIENTSSLMPIPHFSLYQEQADELDKLTARIDKIVAGMRLRGVHDAKLKEIGSVMDATDNQLIPIENAAIYNNAGGIEKAISWMPIEQAVSILQVLNESREKQKAIIDELTGISDIIRGVTDANETYGAQQLKSQYASVRLQRMQKEVQRYMRDLLRLAAQVICAKFGADTLAEMTDLKFPTAQDKQMMQMQMQQFQQQQQMAQPGQPPPQPPFDPSLLQLPSWDDILNLMHSKTLRQFRIDIETDSTIAGMLDSDATGMAQVVKGIGDMMQTMAPAVQSGALPVDAAKELTLAVVRRARMGQAVEDAVEKMKAPNPPPPPPPDPAIQVAQIRAQSDQQIAQMKMQADGQNSVVEHQAIAATEQAKSQMETQRHAAEAQMKYDLELAAKGHEAQLAQLNIQAENQRLAMQLENQRLISDATNQTNLMIAEMAAQQKAQMASQQQAHDLQMAQVTGQQQADQQAKQQKHEVATAEAPTAATYEAVESKFVPVMQELVQHMKNQTELMAKPKTVVRGPDGKIIGVQ